jgi:hypothetical protein
MSELIESIRNLSFSYIKQHYEKYLKKKEKQYLTPEEIAIFSFKLYDKKKNNMIEFIKRNLSEDYDKDEVEQLLIEYTEDREMIVKRVCVEIDLNQKKKN